MTLPGKNRDGIFYGSGAQLSARICFNLLKRFFPNFKNGAPKIPPKWADFWEGHVGGREVCWNWNLHADQGDHIHAKPCNCTEEPFFIFIHISQSSVLLEICLSLSVEGTCSSGSKCLCEQWERRAWIEGKGDERLPLCKFIDKRRPQGCFWTSIFVSPTPSLTRKITVRKICSEISWEHFSDAGMHLC